MTQTATQERQHAHAEELHMARMAYVCPDNWAAAYLGVTAWSRQREVMRAVAAYRRVTVRSGHSVSKSHTAAVLAAWFLNIFNPAIVLTTAPTHRQVKEVLWGELHSLVHGTSLARKGSLLQTEWRLGPRRFALGLSTDEADRFQGFHCPNMLVIVDEAGGVEPEIYDAIRGVLTAQNARLLLIGNPTTPSGNFYDSHKPGSGFHQIHISSLESPNVVEGREVIPGLATREWVEECKAAWGEGSPMYRARVLGEFPESAVNALVPMEAVERARRLELMPTGVPVLGCDVARFGDDKTVIIVRHGGVIREWDERQGADLMETTGRVRIMAKRWKVLDPDIRIDDTGVGGGVTDRLRELGQNVTAVIAGAAAQDTEQYANVRAEMWMRMADAVVKGELSLRGAPERLVGDLCAPTYSFTSKGQRKLEEKAETKRRLKRSPDHGDALALTYAAGTGGPVNWVF